MRPVIVNGKFLAQPLSGVQRFCREIVLGIDALLAESDHGVSVGIALPKGAECDLPLRRIVPVGGARLSGNPWEQTELATLRPDAVLLNLGNTAPLLRGRQVVTIHDTAVFANRAGYTGLFTAWYRFQLPVIARRAERVITVSRFSASEITRFLGVAAGKIEVVPNAADHCARVAADPGILDRLRLARGRYVLALGNNGPHKNFGRIVAATRMLRENGLPLPLVIAGGGDRMFRKTDFEPGPDDILAGRVTDAELRALYEGAGCFVFPSLYEGFGIPALEAMTFGCPVVTSTAEALRETCRDAALYCDPLDVADIARRMEAVLTNPTLANDLRRHGRRRVAEFGWRDSARSVLDTVLRVAAERPVVDGMVGVAKA